MRNFPFSMSPKLQYDPIFGPRKSELPSAAKFRSGHLPSGLIIPVARAIPVGSRDNESGSDMDLCSGSDSDDDFYGARYSVDSLPQDDVISNKAGLIGNSVLRLDNYASDPAPTELSSFGRRRQGKKCNGMQKLGGQGTDVESSDSVASSEASSSLFWGNNGSVALYNSVGYYPRVHPQQNLKRTARQLYHGFQDCQGSRLQNKELVDDGIPSAPPLAESIQEIYPVADQIPTFRSHGTPCPDSSYGSVTTNEPNPSKSTPIAATACDGTSNSIRDPSLRAVDGTEATASFSSLPAHCPRFHESGLGPWCAMITYDACVRLCLYSWARGSVEAPIFLENECILLQNTFGLHQVLLQSEEELLRKPSSELRSEGAAIKPKKSFEKMKVQVRKVKMAPDLPAGCSFSSPTVKLQALRLHRSNVKLSLSSGWRALRKVHVAPCIAASKSFSHQSLAYINACTRYIREVSGLLKDRMTTMRNNSSSYEEVQETYSCLLRLKSLAEEEVVRMQPGSGEPMYYGLGDDLIIEVYDSKGKYCGRVVAQVAAIAEDPGDKLRWWSIYLEPEHERVGRIQLYINYSTSPSENSHLKFGSVAETVAYDLVLEVAMKAQHFEPRNLLLHGPWKWLVTEFASYYGVSDAYSKLRYLSNVMDVATPTADCLSLVHELLVPVVMKGNVKGALSHQENRILGEVFDRIMDILAVVFENYKSLDESSQSGMVDAFRPATGFAAPALEPALKLYNLLHDVLSSESQLKLCRYFQTAAKKRSRRHLSETDEFVSNNNGSTSIDPVTLCMAYQKMKSVCLSIKNEISTDIEIQNQHVMPSYIELPSLSSSIYSVELRNRLVEFLVSCPPNGPSPPVTELIITTDDFQKDLAGWNIKPIKGGIHAKELFHLYITRWILEKRLALLELCKVDKVKWSSVRTQHPTTPFIDDMYDRLKETLKEYEVITCRWPEYTFVLENVLTDVEKAIVETLDKQYVDVLYPLKEALSPIKFGLKYVQKFATGTENIYVVPEELGVLLNSLKRVLEVLRPKIEAQFKSCGGSCIVDGANAVPGEYLSEVSVMLRTKFRTYLQAVVEKLAENIRVQSSTKLKKIIQGSKETVLESDIRSRMQPLKDLLMSTMDQIHTVFETQLFITVCRGFWERMGQDILSFLENRKENRSCYKGSRVAVSILDDTFGSQMQKLLGNALQEKDLEPPRSIRAVRSMLCKDAVNQNDDSYYY